MNQLELKDQLFLNYMMERLEPNEKLDCHFPFYQPGSSSIYKSDNDLFLTDYGNNIYFVNNNFESLRDKTISFFMDYMKSENPHPLLVKSFVMSVVKMIGPQGTLSFMGDLKRVVQKNDTSLYSSKNNQEILDQFQRNTHYPIAGLSTLQPDSFWSFVRTYFTRGYDSFEKSKQHLEDFVDCLSYVSDDVENYLYFERLIKRQFHLSSSACELDKLLVKRNGDACGFKMIPKDEDMIKAHLRAASDYYCNDFEMYLEQSIPKSISDLTEVLKISPYKMKVSDLKLLVARFHAEHGFEKGEDLLFDLLVNQGSYRKDLTDNAFIAIREWNKLNNGKSDCLNRVVRAKSAFFEAKDYEVSDEIEPAIMLSNMSKLKPEALLDIQLNVEWIIALDELLKSFDFDKSSFQMIKARFDESFIAKVYERQLQEDQDNDDLHDEVLEVM